MHLSGQVVQKWAARYHGEKHAETYVYPSDMTIDSGGNVYVWGRNIQGNQILFKYNRDGKLIWADSGELVSWESQKMAIDKADSVYVTGSRHETEAILSDNKTPLRDCFVAKYNAEGDQLWTYYYGRGSTTDIGIDNVGSIYVTCMSFNGNKTVDYSTVKYSTQGSEIWKRSLLATCSDECHYCYSDFGLPIALVATPEGHVCITGCYNTFAYDQAGIELWNMPYEGQDIAVDGSGNVCVTSLSGTVMFDSEGVVLWRVQGKGSAVTIDSSSNVFTTGLDGTLKYNIHGQLLWTIPPMGRYLVSDKHGGVFIAREIGQTGYGYVNMWIGHYDSEGKAIWSAEYDGGVSGPDSVKGLEVDSDGYVYVIGESSYKECTSYSLQDVPETDFLRESVLIKFKPKE